jgi:tetratricopeptide (TPR) repeat protein
MLLGVMARDAGDRERAIADLRKAHEIDPEAPNPALELGFTLEAKHPREARKVYEQILAHDPASRPAILGLARVARSQNRLDEARRLYDRLLAVNPKDPEALNGLAWLALAERNREQAQAGFEHVLAIAPDNGKLKDRLAPDVYRCLLDTSATWCRRRRHVLGSGARGWPVSLYDTGVGRYHFAND